MISWIWTFLIVLISNQSQSLLRQPSVTRPYNVRPSRAVVKFARIGGGSDFDEEENDYSQKLAQAEAAIAAAQRARQELLRQQQGGSEKPAPIQSSAKISRSDAGTLMIELPKTGFNTNAALNGAFSAAWFSAVIPATLSGAGLFMLPFWAAGGMVAKSAVVDPFISTSLSIGQYAWSLESIYAGTTINKKEGPTEQLRGANAEVVSVVNGVPRFELQLYTTKGVTGLGLGLSEEELEYLAAEINEHLSTIQIQEPR